MSVPNLRCNKCETENPSAAKFCANCGTPLIAPSPVTTNGYVPIAQREFPSVNSPSEPERLMARMKSYTGSAVLTFFLYLLFWFPGLIVNFVYLNEAKRMEKVAGQSLPGTGCLSVMLWLNIIGFALGILCICGYFAIGISAFLVLPSPTPGILQPLPTRVPFGLP